MCGPLECSISVDTFGKQCLEQKKYLSYFKGKVGVPPLAMIDDVAYVAKCNSGNFLKKFLFNLSINIFVPVSQIHPII